MPSRKGVKIPSRLPVKIPDNKHYLEFLVLKVGNKRLAGLVFREMIISGNYQRFCFSWCAARPAWRGLMCAFDGSRPSFSFGREVANMN